MTWRTVVRFVAEYLFAPMLAVAAPVAVEAYASRDQRVCQGCRARRREYLGTISRVLVGVWMTTCASCARNARCANILIRETSYEHIDLRSAPQSNRAVITAVQEFTRRGRQCDQEGATWRYCYGGRPSSVGP